MGKDKRIQRTLWDLQKRFGANALNLFNTREKQVVSTGFPALDAVLPEGGLPRGKSVLLSGRPTSGMTTFAHKIVAASQGKEGMAVYFDHSTAFDPDYAARCGVVLERLLVVQPSNLLHSLSIGRDLVREGEVEIIVFDIMTQGDPADALVIPFRRFNEALSRSSVLVLFLCESGGHIHPIMNPSLYLRIERREWLYQGQDVNGYRVAITILKDRQQVLLDFTFDSTVQGDGA